MLELIRNRGFKMLYDMHTHCNFSPDSPATLDEMCRSAIGKGIKAIALTDHLDVFSNLPFGMLYCGQQIHRYDASAIRAAVLAAREKYGDKLTLLYGVELAQPHVNPLPCERFVKETDFDVVIGSLHCFYSGAEYYWAEYDDKSVDTLLKIYLDSELEMVRWGNFDVLAHLDYVLRYVRRAGLPHDFSGHMERVRAIFELIIKKDIALEINMGGFRYPTGVGPDAGVIKTYREMGGKLLSIGSDSHRPEHFNQGLDNAFAIAREAGFKEAVYYQKRIPHFYKFDD